MKKLLFSAMACIAFVSSAFASDTSLMTPEYPCEIYVTVIDRETGDILEVSANLSKIGGVPCLELGAKIYRDYVALYPNADIQMKVLA